jgi:hypothetical protein
MAEAKQWISANASMPSPRWSTGFAASRSSRREALAIMQTEMIRQANDD